MDRKLNMSARDRHLESRGGFSVSSPADTGWGGDTQGRTKNERCAVDCRICGRVSWQGFI